MLRAVGVGLSYESAARVAGVARSTLYEWLQDEGFRTACEKRRGTLALTCAAVLMQQAVKGNVRAAMFLLSTRCREFRRM